MPRRNPCRLYIHLAFTYFVGPSSIVWSKLGPAPPFPPMRVLELQWPWALSLVYEVAVSVRWGANILLQHILNTLQFSKYMHLYMNMDDLIILAKRDFDFVCRCLKYQTHVFVCFFICLFVETQNICVVYLCLEIIWFIFDHTLWTHQQHIPTTFFINMVKRGHGAWVAPMLWQTLGFFKWMDGKCLTQFHPSSRNIY